MTSQDTHNGRPAVENVLSEADVLGWYWLRSELVEIARRHHIQATGSKTELTARIADTLAGRPMRTPPARRATGPQLADELEGHTVVPPGQRCSQLLRAYLAGRIGPGFRFDGAMRSKISTGGVTLDDVVEHWHATRGDQPTVIGEQFEYNRFNRAWRNDHPDGSREAMLTAWWAHRAAPRSTPPQNT